jgi:hypothetical protein
MPDTSVQTTSKSKQQLLWGLVCLIGPTALIVISVLLYAIVNFVAGSTTQTGPSDTELFAQPSPVHTISNVVLFVIGAISVATWLPGIIVGIILLATRK